MHYLYNVKKHKEEAVCKKNEKFITTSELTLLHKKIKEKKSPLQRKDVKKTI